MFMLQLHLYIWVTSGSSLPRPWKPHSDGRDDPPPENIPRREVQETPYSRAPPALERSTGLSFHVHYDDSS